jgi:hypothetical protein
VFCHTSGTQHHRNIGNRFGSHRVDDGAPKGTLLRSGLVHQKAKDQQKEESVHGLVLSKCVDLDRPLEKTPTIASYSGELHQSKGWLLNCMKLAFCGMKGKF